VYCGQSLLTNLKTNLRSSSAVAKRPRDASFMSVVSLVALIVQHLERIFLLLVTSASDLPVRTIRFCSVVYSVSARLVGLALLNHGDGDWLSCVALGGRIPAYPQYMTSDISVITCGTVAVVHRQPCWQHLPVAALTSSSSLSSSTGGIEARYSLRIAISAYPTCIRPPPPVRGSLSEYRHPAWYVRETRMVGLPDGEKSLTIRLLVSTQLTNVTDTQTDTAWRHRPRLYIASPGKNTDNLFYKKIVVIYLLIAA